MPLRIHDIIKRKVAAVYGDGHIRLIEEDMPKLRAGTVFVEVHASLVSPGSALGGWHNLYAKSKNPDLQSQPLKIGYSNAGLVLAVGEGVTEFNPGDRIACIGGDALHCDYSVVPQNLCTALPEGVTYEQGSYAMLAATSLMGLRRGEPQFGEYTAVVGLGIVGCIAARLYQLAGNYVIGWDPIPFRNELAKKCGIDVTVTIGKEDAVTRTKDFTNNLGLDAAVIAFGGDANKTMETLYQCMKCSPDEHRMGRIIVLGGVEFRWINTTSNLDIRRASRTGPGYHDEGWEYGLDYPEVFMRWTTRTNIELCLCLMAEGKLDVDALTTHKILLDRVDEEISEIVNDPDHIQGVIFTRS